MSLESEALSGRPSTSQNEEVIEKVCQIVMEDCRLTLRKIVEEVRISRGSVHSILTEDLYVWRVLAEFIPKLLMEQQKEQLHHNNVPTHSIHVIKGFLVKNNMALVQQPPYSPDLAPCNFWLFPKLKTMLKGS